MLIFTDWEHYNYNGVSGVLVWTESAIRDSSPREMFFYLSALQFALNERLWAQRKYRWSWRFAFGYPLNYIGPSSKRPRASISSIPYVYTVLDNIYYMIDRWVDYTNVVDYTDNNGDWSGIEYPSLNSSSSSDSAASSNSSWESSGIIAPRWNRAKLLDDMGETVWAYPSMASIPIVKAILQAKKMLDRCVIFRPDDFHPYIWDEAEQYRMPKGELFYKNGYSRVSYADCSTDFYGNSYTGTGTPPAHGNYYTYAQCFKKYMNTEFNIYQQYCKVYIEPDYDASSSSDSTQSISSQSSSSKSSSSSTSQSISSKSSQSSSSNTVSSSSSKSYSTDSSTSETSSDNYPKIDFDLDIYMVAKKIPWSSIDDQNIYYHPTGAIENCWFKALNDNPISYDSMPYPYFEFFNSDIITGDYEPPDCTNPGLANKKGHITIAAVAVKKFFNYFKFKDTSLPYN